MARAKCIILDGVKDHVVPHIAKKEMTVEMWEALKIQEPVSAYLNAKKNVAREPAEVVSDEEGSID